MTGAPPVQERPALRAALADLRIELPGTSTRFEQALAEKQGWMLHFAERVTEEYRRFLYLAATARREVTPSQAVDEAWHLHLTLPHYREILCDRIVGRLIEHRPATDAPEDEARCQAQYEETMVLYKQTFGNAPPEDIWPRRMSADAATVGRVADRPRDRALRRAALGLLASGMVALPFSLVAALVLFGLSVGAYLFTQPAAAGTGKGGQAGCGGSCGGSTSAGDGCGASCGGGSCGGGGCGGD